MVKVEGSLEPRSIFILTPVKGAGAGFRVISPFRQKDGSKILIDRGVIKEKEKNRLETLGQQRSVIGYLFWPNETDYFTPEPNLKRNIWFSRDLEKMASFLKAQPILVVATEQLCGNRGIPIAAPSRIFILIHRYDPPFLGISEGKQLYTPATELLIEQASDRFNPLSMLSMFDVRSISIEPSFGSTVNFTRTGIPSGNIGGIGSWKFSRSIVAAGSSPIALRIRFSL